MTYLSIPIWRVAMAGCLVVVAMALSRFGRLGLEKELGVGALRAAAQLIAIGYALRLLLASDHPLAVCAVLTLMWTIAAYTSTGRIKVGPPRAELFPCSFVAIGVGAAAALLPVIAFVLRPNSWFDPRYVIPIGGMMLSSAMNVVSQVFERLFASAASEAATLEQALALGANAKQALAPHVTSALRGALIPTINGLVTVGLVSLPGMMTGQIVGGAAPEQAVRYQIVVMYQLVAVAAISGAVAAWFARRLLFTSDTQLRTWRRRTRDVT